MEKPVAYHSSRGVPVRELSDRCDRTLDRARRTASTHYHAEQREWYDHVLDGGRRRGRRRRRATPAGDPVQRVLARPGQPPAPTSRACPPRALTGSGYEGHYFWDTEIYVVPFLSYTLPDVARNAAALPARMLPAARERAREMAQSGALFPWRTINGEEASAYYAAGTAGVHIDADVAYALMKYVRASGNEGFLVRDGIDMLVETARMWVDLGFWRTNGERTFHIHGVTGPDEYTTVVNNNLFTNVMARANLEAAVRAVEHVRDRHPVAWDRAASRLDIEDGRGRRVARVRGGDDDPVRRGPRDPPAGRLLPGPGGLGPLPDPGPSCSRCCSTTTRW